MVGIKNKFAFVLPRYWKGIAGGAETLVGNIAERLAQRGEKVQIITTTAKDNRTWENYFKEETVIENNIEIIRFKVSERDLDRWIPLQINLSEGRELSIDEQLDWISEGVNSMDMYEYLKTNKDEFEYIFFAPYLFGTTFWGSQICAGNAVLFPCLHDESYAYLNLTRSMFESVRGAMFNSIPEKELANRLFGNIAGGVVGMGFDPYPQGYAESLLPYFPDASPYILYLGRKETGKNVQLLVDFFVKYKNSSFVKSHIELASLKLVVAGGGDFKDLFRPEAAMRGDVIDLSHVTEEEKQRLIKHALVLCQPSTNESFSIVLMEAWLLGSPVLVHSQCAVTKRHVIDSSGGLYFGDYEDFCGTITELLKSKNLREELGMSGKSYVSEQYSWDRVMDRFDRVLATL